MTWLDIVAFLLFVLVAWAESVRGFGRALFDLLGAVIVFQLGPALAGVLAGGVTVVGEAGGNGAFWLALITVGLAVGVVLLTRLLYQSTLLSLDYMDPVLGGTLGLGTGLIAVFFFLRVLQLAYGDSDAGQALIQSFAGQEVLELRSLHAVVDALRNLGRV